MRRLAEDAETASLTTIDLRDDFAPKIFDTAPASCAVPPDSLL